MAKDVGNSNMVSILLRSSLSSRYVRLILLVVLAAAVGAVYLYRDSLLETYSSIHENVISRLGFGVVVVGLWLCVLGFALVARRSWFSHYRLWLASPFALAFILGALSFATSFQGPLTAFTLDDGTLGGTLGYAIAGEVAWFGWIRLAGLLVIAGLVASPRLSLNVVSTLGGALAALYVFAAGAVLWIGRQFGNITHRSSESDSDEEDPAQRRWSEELRRKMESSEYQERVFTSSALEAADETRGLDVPPETSEQNGLHASPTVEDGAEAGQEYAVQSEIDASAPVVDDGVAVRGEHVDEEESGAAYFVEDGDGVQEEYAGRGEMDAAYPDEEGIGVPAGQVESPADGVIEDDGTDRILQPDGVEAVSIDPESVRWRGPGSEGDGGREPGWKFNDLWEQDGSDSSDSKEEDAVELEADVVGEDGSNGRVSSMVQAVADGVVTSTWDKPPLSMFVDANEGGIEPEEMEGTARTIRETLGNYGVEVEVEDTQPGPTVTMYGLVPGWIRRYKQVNVTDSDGKPKLDEKGRQIKTSVETKTRVKVDAITAREKDLALALKTPSIRIETPVMGKSLVGVEVPNPNPALVTLRNVMQDREFEDLRKKAKLPVGIGKGGSGETVVIDLAKMPHLLVAGSTGSGKSVFVNTVMSCLLIQKDPSELRLLLIDPKRVELTPYNGIPHLLTPVVVETDQVVNLLRGLIREMMDRYRKMEEIGVRNIDSYNKKSPDQMPYLVVAVDELADLMMTASVDVEQALCRLAQLGRATGIHLIVATQRPSVDVLTGLIKANFPSRVSFALTSQVDSRTILDSSGAEKLLGKGDMLYQSVDMSRPERVQGVFISDAEIESLVEFWQTTPRGPIPDVDIEPVAGSGETDATQQGDASEDRDDMMDKAIELATRQKKVSTSLLQRRLRIGYPRAARLMDQLEDEGIVGPSDGSKSRDVIIGQV